MDNILKFIKELWGHPWLPVLIVGVAGSLIANILYNRCQAVIQKLQDKAINDDNVLKEKFVDKLKPSPDNIGPIFWSWSRVRHKIYFNMLLVVILSVIFSMIFILIPVFGLATLFLYIVIMGIKVRQIIKLNNAERILKSLIKTEAQIDIFETSWLNIKQK